jgi:hypothetical protein
VRRLFVPTEEFKVIGGHKSVAHPYWLYDR